jgi:murein DD-endopeptidase MepM/ murein hydrolase activator NlpD
VRQPVGIGTPVIRMLSMNNTFGKDIRIDEKTKLPRDHDGWDLSCFVGSRVYAVLDANISMISSSYGRYGKTVILECMHRGFKYFVLYGHLLKISINLEQKTVREGDVIGLSGQTGNADRQHYLDAHLHFEVRKRIGGGAIDPGILIGYEPVTDVIKSELAPALEQISKMPMTKY